MKFGVNLDEIHMFPMVYVNLILKYFLLNKIFRIIKKNQDLFIFISNFHWKWCFRLFSIIYDKFEWNLNGNIILLTQPDIWSSNESAGYLYRPIYWKKEKIHIIFLLISKNVFSKKYFNIKLTYTNRNIWLSSMFPPNIIKFQWF